MLLLPEWTIKVVIHVTIIIESSKKWKTAVMIGMMIFVMIFAILLL
jgi:hypothetical protein